MGSSMKRGVSKQKRKEQKAEQKRKRKEKIRFYTKLNIACSVGILLFSLSLLVFSLITEDEYYNANLSMILAVLSLLVTFSYEVYEWIKMFSSNKIISTIPLSIAFLLLFLIAIIKFFTNIWDVFFPYTNLICAITLLIYALLVTIRTIVYNVNNN